MNKKISAAVLLFCLAFATPSLAGPQDFVLTNASAAYICYVYISPPKAADWGEDVLGDDCIAPGTSYKISFNGATQPVWDLMVEDDDGNTEEYYGFKLTSISEIAIKGGGQASYR